jgi:general secretion pathway protein I
MRRPDRQRGFSLLEAIVALTLMSSVGLALFAWANSTRLSLLRVQDASERQEATLNAVEFMKLVNPMLEPTGSTSLGRVRLNWTSEAVTPATEGMGFPNGASLYALAVYRVTVTLDRDEQTGWHRFDFKHVGYRRIREPVDFMPR